MATAQLKPGLVSMSLTNATVKNAVKSYTMSSRYINQMLKATAINIIYYRLNIDKKEFLRKTFKNISFQTPKSKSRNTYIRQYNGYMNACKDAIEKNYLRDFYLYFIDADTEDVLEYYKFSFKYGSTGEPNPSQNEENLTNITCELLQTLQDFEKHPKLDGHSIEIGGELTYFEDTPDEYQPPGFEALDESEALATKLNRGGNSVVLCSLYTGFHKLMCLAKGGIFQLHDGSETCIGDKMDIEESNPPVIKEDLENTPLDRAQLVPDPAVFTDFKPKHVKHEYNKASELEASKTSCKLNNTYPTYMPEGISINSIKNESARGFDCRCKLDSKSDDLWSPDIMECTTCNRKSHVACNGYLDKTFVGRPFICNRCVPTSDSYLLDFDSFETVCRIRYLLACMYKFSRIPTELEHMLEDPVMSALVKDVKKEVKDGNNSKPSLGSMGTLEQFFNFVVKKPDPSKLITEY